MGIGCIRQVGILGGCEGKTWRELRLTDEGFGKVPRVGFLRRVTESDWLAESLHRTKFD